jgi:hypothetical protein
VAVKAFSLSGRFRVIVAMPFSLPTLICVYAIANRVHPLIFARLRLAAR